MGNLAHGFYFSPDQLAGKGADAAIKDDEEKNAEAIKKFLGLDENSVTFGDVNYGNEGRRTQMDYLFEAAGLSSSATSGVPDATRIPTPLNNKAADRVNANTAYHGGRAIVDAKGGVTLTNQNPDGTWNPGGELARMAGPTKTEFANPSVPVPVTPTAPTLIQKNLEQMALLDDPIQMRALANQSKDALAVERSKLAAEAIRFAETKYGVPELETRLNQSIAADANFPAERAMHGDSPVTKQLRASLDGIRSLVKTEADKFLITNPNARILDNAERSIDQETARMEKIGTVRLNRSILKEEQNEEFVASLTDEQKQRVQILADAQGTMTSAQMAMKFKTLKGSAGAAELAAIQAPKEELPRLALNGNLFARKLFITQEKAITKEPPAVIEAKLTQVQKILLTPSEFNVAYSRVTRTPLSKEAGGPFAEFENKARMASKEEQAQMASQKYQIVMSYMQLDATDTVLKDMGVLNSSDMGLNAAINGARTTVNSTALAPVLTSWLNLNKADTVEKKLHFAKMFSDKIKEESKKYQGSSFGSPNPETLNSMVVAAMRQDNSWLSGLRAWQQAAANTYKTNMTERIKETVKFEMNPLTNRMESVDNWPNNGLTIEELSRGQLSPEK